MLVEVLLKKEAEDEGQGTIGCSAVNPIETSSWSLSNGRSGAVDDGAERRKRRNKEKKRQREKTRTGRGGFKALSITSSE